MDTFQLLGPRTQGGSPSYNQSNASNNYSQPQGGAPAYDAPMPEDDGSDLPF